MNPQIRDNPAVHRYEIEVDGQTAYVRYTRKPGVITFIHTEVPEGLAGKGIGSRLARHVLDAARAEGLQVVPVCPFIDAWMKKHPEYDDLRLSVTTRAGAG
jgi:predicted GNAT family acetyltransferase